MRGFLFSLSLCLSPLAFALPHLDLEMTSGEYKEKLEQLPKNLKADPDIENSIKAGERLSKWIMAINASRSVNTAIRLTSAQTRRGVPIETPSFYSPVTIRTGLAKILSELPEPMKTVLTSNTDVPTSLGISDELFITHARLLDKNYQDAARYRLVNEYRDEYIQAANSDVRGYYFLMINKIGAAELNDVSVLDASKVKLIKDALVGICFNSKFESAASCVNKVNTAFSNNALAALYSKYISKAEKNWNEFFVIPSNAAREDVTWTGSTMIVPFNTPSIAKFIPYLQDNIQDEFRFETWGLKLQFGTYTNGPRLVFKPGVVPHVNGLGGNQIVMDSNQPIEEYESQWTIRHEFGHVIGLPDCYHEFYDTNLQAYVNYQLDISDLMCSRAGNMNKRIFTELKKAYGK